MANNINVRVIYLFYFQDMVVKFRIKSFFFPHNTTAIFRKQHSLSLPSRTCVQWTRSSNLSIQYYFIACIALCQEHTCVLFICNSGMPITASNIGNVPECLKPLRESPRPVVQYMGQTLPGGQKQVRHEILAHLPEKHIHSLTRTWRPHAREHGGTITRSSGALSRASVSRGSIKCGMKMRGGLLSDNAGRRERRGKCNFR